MTKQIEAVPESITREQYLSWFRNCGIDPKDTLSLKFTGRGVHAKIIERDPDGNRMVATDQSGWVTSNVFIPVYPYGDKTS